MYVWEKMMIGINIYVTGDVNILIMLTLAGWYYINQWPLDIETY